MFLFKKQNQIHQSIKEHTLIVLECYKKMNTFIEELFLQKNKIEENNMIIEVSYLEKKADLVRREIILKLMKGELLPESRRDILTLIERMDKIANFSEELMKQYVFQKPKMESFLMESILEINKITINQLEILKELIEALLENFAKAYEKKDYILKIEELESCVDKIEDDTVIKIFESNESLSQKIQWKSFITRFAEISDLTEDISDLVEIILATRKI